MVSEDTGEMKQFYEENYANVIRFRIYCEGKPGILENALKQTEENLNQEKKLTTSKTKRTDHFLRDHKS